MSTNHEIEKRGRGRPPSDTVAMQLRLSANLVEAIDAKRRVASTFPSRQDVIRDLLIAGLKSEGIMK
jgi:hypothetical protein